MATPPYAGQQTNIAANVGGVTAAALPTGLTGQYNLASLLPQLAGGAYGGGTANINALLSLLGAAGQGPGAISTGLQTELTGLTQGTQLEQEGANIIGTGQVTPEAAALIKQNLSDQTAAVRAKYASLGMSGSTAETQEIADLTNRSEAQQFQIANQQGGALAGIGGQIISGAGAIGSNILGSGISMLNTAGSLATTLAQLGLSTFSLTSTDLTNIANEGLSGMGMESGIYSDLARQQLTEDQTLTNSIGGFFKALGGNTGILSSVASLLPGGSSLFGGAGAGGINAGAVDIGSEGGLAGDLAFAALA